MQNEIRIHPAAMLFPEMSKNELAALVEDIRENGVRTRLQFIGETWDDAQLLDGRNRLKALKELGLAYRDHSDLIPAADIADPVDHVLSLNLHRRHLTESQRGMVAAKVATLKLGANQHSSIELPSTQAAAARLNVSVATVKRARKVKEKAVPEIAAAVESGEVTVAAAAGVSELPVDEQSKLAVEGPKAIKAKAASLRHEKKAEAAPVQQAVAERASLFDPTQFDEAMRDPDVVRDSSGQRAMADKLLAKLVPDAESLQKLLEKTINAIDAFNELTPVTTQRSIVSHYHRAHGDLTTARDAIRHMKRQWESGLKDQS